MPKPERIVNFQIPAARGVNVKTYSRAVKNMDSPNTAQYGAGVYDATFGAAYTDEQRELMRANGLDEFDMIFIDGQSVRDRFGYNASAVGMGRSQEAMKAAVIGALMDADKKVEFCGVERTPEGLKATPPTAVQADLRLKEAKPRLGFWDKVRQFFGLSIPADKMTNAEKARGLHNESADARKERHSKIADALGERARQVKQTLDKREPLMKAVEAYNQLEARNSALYNDHIKDGDTLLSGETAREQRAKWGAVFTFDPRPSEVDLEMNLYMLHRGLTLEQVVSSDPAHDAKKIQYANDFYTLLREAAEPVLKAKQEAEETSNQLFDRMLDRESFQKNYVAQNPGRVKDLTQEQLAEQVEAAIQRQRNIDAAKAIETATANLMRNSPEIGKLRNTFLEMGRAMGDQKMPSGNLSDLHGTLDEYAKLAVLKGISHNHRTYLSTLRHTFTPEQKQEFEFHKDVETAMGLCVIPYVETVDFVASEKFSQPEMITSADLTRTQMNQQWLPTSEKLVRGKETYRDLGLSVKDMQYVQETVEIKDGKEYPVSNTLTGRDALENQYADHSTQVMTQCTSLTLDAKVISQAFSGYLDAPKEDVSSQFVKPSTPAKQVEISDQPAPQMRKDPVEMKSGTLKPKK
ncbi:MAG: hypothetical protein FWG93_00090 [Oscillospiraceae bacterium]|nr:hypothetical protein [Oscillospiraceae bacterium]